MSNSTRGQVTLSPYTDFAMYASLTLTALDYLKVMPAAPDLGLLERLISAYVRRVPWESASRIAARFGGVGVYPRWPEVFWQQAITLGTGGTCFESNYAFFTLLRDLGYEGYLTINNMGATVGCHTAIVLLLDSQRWLVDVGLPLFAPLPVESHQPTTRESDFLYYTVRPVGQHLYDIEREPHPSRVAFTLIDRPVDEPAYRAALEADYEPGGYFLDRVVINRVVDEGLWRFGSSDIPYRLEHFPGNSRVDHPIEGDAAEALAQHFEMDAHVLRTALEVVESRA